MSYALVADLQALFPTTIDPTRAQALLNMAAGDIDNYIAGSNWPGATLTRRLAQTDRVRPSGGKLVYLPGPTTAVYSVTIEWVDGTPAGQLLDPANWLFHPERNLLERIDGSYWPGGAGTTVYYPSGGSATLSPLGLVVPGSYAALQVNRDTGFAAGSYPQTLINVNVAIAARMLAQPPGVDMQRLDNYQVKFQPMGDRILDSEKRDLDKWSWAVADLYGA